MNGQRLWVVIGPIAALAGLALITIGIRAGRSSKNPTSR
jgi:uncharacterized membrane protein